MIALYSQNTLCSLTNRVTAAYILKEECHGQSTTDDGVYRKVGAIGNETNGLDCAHGENKMSIHDFRSKFVSGSERNTLFVALRKLSLLEDPRSLFAEESAGWPIWDENGGPVQAPGVAGS